MASQITLHGATSGTTALIAASVASGTLTLPAVTGTLLHDQAGQTFPAFTLGGNITGNGKDVTGLGALGATSATIGASNTASLTATFDGTNANGTYIQLSNSTVPKTYLGSAKAIGATGTPTAGDSALYAAANLYLEAHGGTIYGTGALSLGTNSLTAGAGTFGTVGGGNAKLIAGLSGTSSGEVLQIGNATTGVFGGLGIADGGTYPIKLWGSQVQILAGNSVLSSATLAATFTSAGINGVLGGTTPAAATVTTLTANTKASIGASADTSRSLNVGDIANDSIVQLKRVGAANLAVIEFTTGATQDFLIGPGNGGGGSTSDFNIWSFGTASNVFTIAKATGAVTIPGTLAFGSSTSPTSGGTGAAGQLAWDGSYLYICTATNTWRRVATTGGY